MLSKIEFKGVVGVGDIKLDLEEDKRVYCFIGENGVGKTKLLESLFQKFFFSNYKANTFTIKLPTILLASQNRGYVKDTKIKTNNIMGNFKDRQKQYLEMILEYQENDNFNMMNMDVDINEWFSLIISNSSKWQKKEENREIEIIQLLDLLHKIDNRIDKEFLEKDSNDSIYLKVNEEVRKLSELSSGFTSLLKIIQSIISGYAYFTNERNLAEVKGVVLIDEIESHLHISWQSKIIPLLKKLFPNTTFYITTHSSIILSHLKEGEAYKLYKDNDDIVKTKKIENIQNYFLSDIVNDVFGVDLNRDKLENIDKEKQKKAKNMLLELAGKIEFEKDYE